jgi:hypothetical protein
LVADKNTSCLFTLAAHYVTSQVKTAFVIESSATYPNGTMTLFECVVPSSSILMGNVRPNVTLSLMIGDIYHQSMPKLVVPVSMESSVVSIYPTLLRLGV